MLKFKKNVNERRILAKRLGELTGIHPMYTRAPLYAYEVGDYLIDRSGDLFIDENKADEAILKTLMEEGLIGDGEIVSEEAQAGPIEVTVGTAADSAVPEETVGTEPEGQQQAETDTEPETESGAEPMEAAVEDEAEDTVSDAEYQQEIEEEAAAQADAIDMNMAFPISIGRHTGTSLRNLINLIYSRGALINKATGGHFSVDEELVETLKDDSCTFSRANFLKMVGDYETQHGKSLYGLTITPEELRFTGFGEAPDMEHLTAYGHLAVLMNEQALNQKRIQAKAVDDTNEKYAMRIWLVRIGMDGDEFKKTRKILMENLGGHTAFRTPADAEKARIKNQKKRDALKAAKEEAASGQAQTGSMEPGEPSQSLEATVDTAGTAEVEAAL